MKRSAYITGLIGLFLSFSVHCSSLELQVSAKQNAKINLLLVVVGNATSELLECAGILKKDMEFSGSFSVTVKTMPTISTVHELKSLYAAGYPLAIFINEEARGVALEWRLYDTNMATHMIKGKNYVKRDSTVRGWAHHIADALWPELTSQEGFFSSKIAYCKEVLGLKRRPVKHIYIADYDGSNAQPLVTTPTINVAPRFNRDSKMPLLFYSETTSANMRLMTIDMKKTRKIASNFNGINMLPTFSSNGSKLIYCASHGTGTCQLYHYEHKQLTRLTNNMGNNISPTVSDDGTRLFYCSDYQQGRPQIYCLDLVSGAETAITDGTALCFCPSYCGKKKQLAYTKLVKGKAQVFVYDELTKKHRQLTFDGGNKDECSWSPCGNYLLYNVENGSQGRIALLNMATGDQRFITASGQTCSYPTWSPVYERYPVVA